MNGIIGSSSHIIYKSCLNPCPNYPLSTAQLTLISTLIVMISLVHSCDEIAEYVLRTIVYVSDEDNLFKIANMIIAKYGHLSYHMACGTLTDGRSALALYARAEVTAKSEHQSIDRDGSMYYRWCKQHVPLQYRYGDVVVNRVRPYVIDSQYHEELKSVELWDSTMSKLLNMA